jgi:hypothetical protein
MRIVIMGHDFDLFAKMIKGEIDKQGTGEMMTYKKSEAGRPMKPIAMEAINALRESEDFHRGGDMINAIAPGSRRRRL